MLARRCIDRSRCTDHAIAIGATTTTTKRVPVGVSCCAPIAAVSLSHEEAEATAIVFKALADPHRVGIINLLARSPDAVCVCDITEHLGLSQPTTSFHLKKLVSAGLLEREQRGVWAYYSIREGALERLRELFAA